MRKCFVMGLLMLTVLFYCVQYSSVQAETTPLANAIQKLVKDALVKTEDGRIILTEKGKETKEVLQYLALLNNEKVLSAYLVLDLSDKD